MPDPRPSPPDVPAWPDVPRGLSTKLGVALAVLGFAGTVVAALETDQVATIVGGAGTVGTFVTLFGLRVAQGLALLRTATPTLERARDVAQAADGRERPAADELAPDELLARLDRLADALERMAERAERPAADRS